MELPHYKALLLCFKYKFTTDVISSIVAMMLPQLVRFIINKAVKSGSISSSCQQA